MDKIFIIVLGDIDNRHHDEMISNMKRLGSTRRILDNVYVLTTEQETTYEEIRNRVCGPNNGYCIVISLRGLKSAWCLEPSNATYLQAFFTHEEPNENQPQTPQ